MKFKNNGNGIVDGKNESSAINVGPTREDVVRSVFAILDESHGTLFLRHDNDVKARRALAEYFTREIVWPALQRAIIEA